MLRRSLLVLAVLSAGMARGAIEAQAVEPREGRDYTLVSPALPRADGARIVVQEFFSYGCPHCFAFAPELARWEATLADDVALDRVAVALGREPWTLLAQLFYALRSLGKERELDAAVFDAVHVERADFSTVRQLADWVAARGVERPAFEAALGSFSVKSFAARGEQLARSAQVRSVPTVIVDGRYRVAIDTSGDLAGQLKVVDALVARARAERGGAATPAGASR
jgi:thiol:disulfide interchange protein DsbA